MPQFFQLLVPPVVAGFVDQFFGLGQVALCEAVIGEKEAHAGAGGDAEDFVEVAGGGAGEEGAGEVVELSCAAEEIDSLVEMMSGFGRAGGVGVGANVEESALLPLQGLGGSAKDF